MDRRALRAMLVVLFAVALAGCDIWPMFHLDPLHSGVSTDNAAGAAHAPNLALRWKTLLSTGQHVEASPAVAYNSTLSKTLVYTASFATFGNSVVDAIDLATGNVVWTTSITGSVYSSPAVSGNSLYFGTVSFGTHSALSKLVVLDATTGASQCTFAAAGQIFDSPVVATVDNTGPVVFFGDSGASEDSNAGHEWAINGVGNTAGACTRKWAFNAWNNTVSGTKTGSWSPPAIAKDSTGRFLVVLGSSDPDDSVYALDATTGSQVWRFQSDLTGSDIDVGAGPTISPPGANGFAHGVVYIDGKNGFEYALDLLTGTQIWKYDLRANSGGVLVDSEQVSAAFTGDALIVSYAGYVFSLNPSTGAQNWRSAAAGGDYLSSPVVSGSHDDRVIIMGDDAGVEHAYRFTNGASLFSYTTGGAISSTVAIAQGTVLFGSDDGYLYALR